MKFTHKQEHLYSIQDEEPLFTYINTKTGKRNFGLARLGTCSIHLTLSLRPLFEKGCIVLEDEYEMELLSGSFKGNFCRIVK